MFAHIAEEAERTTSTSKGTQVKSLPPPEETAMNAHERSLSTVPVMLLALYEPPLRTTTAPKPVKSFPIKLESLISTELPRTAKMA